MKNLVHLLLVPIFVLGLAPEVLSHPNGVSKIRVELRDPDSIWIRVDANHGDVTNATHDFPQPGVATPADYQRSSEKAAYYIRSRLKAEVDGRGLSDLKVVGWNKDGKADLSLVDSADFKSDSFVFDFACRLPNPQGKLSMGVELFLEFGIQPISEVSVYWHGQLVRRSWLTPDKMLHLPMHRDSLMARIVKTANPTGEPAASQTDGGFLKFLGLGFTHILPHGLDHILFVLGLFFFSTLLRPLLWQITAFTVAHSVTLALSILDIIDLPARIVEPIIALSIAYVAVENIFFRKMRPMRWVIVFLFGLVHGMGFAGVLKGLGIPEAEFWTTLIGFNLGVEGGQLAVIALVAFATVWFRKKPWYFRFIVVPVSSGIAITGLFWAMQRIFQG